jgi:hypothetical protein
MKTLIELRAFCEGYAKALVNDRAIYGNSSLDTLAGIDEWVVWGEYDINFAGADYSGHAKNDNDLHVDAYKAGWVDTLGEPIHSFTIYGETA